MDLEAEAEHQVQLELLLILRQHHQSLLQAVVMVEEAHQVQEEDREVQEVHQEELETLEDILRLKDIKVHKMVNGMVKVAAEELEVKLSTQALHKQEALEALEHQQL